MHPKIVKQYGLRGAAPCGTGMTAFPQAFSRGFERLCTASEPGAGIWRSMRAGMLFRSSPSLPVNQKLNFDPFLSQWCRVIRHSE